MKKTKNYTISIPVKIFWLVYVPLGLVLSCAGILAGIFAVDRFVMPKIAGVDRDMVAIPDVQGVPYEDGRNKLFGVGLLTEIRGREFDDKVADGSIIDQFPEAGAMVKKGRKIAVTVSRGNEVAVIPPLRQLSERQARLELRKSGFSVGRVRKAYSESHPVDQVIESFPPAGTAISRALEVELVISRGARPTHSEVPNIIGESLSEARKAIEEAGLRVGKVDYQNNPALVPGTVVSQSAAPGSRVPLDSSLDLVISAIR
ncbi:MAG: PASTA domain-containing protein [Chitinispirillales bacterium]|jgi:serine/threonine-protein kinase|nr:PASTA domain-containing protein [Chitinispirillales bacterium]